MASIKGRDTRPELLVRSLVHRLGYRFRLHDKRLPGVPDIVLARHRKVIFVHGCFWHGHKKCMRSRRPEQNRAFWRKKLDANATRDKKDIQLLKKSGWEPIIVWECELKDSAKVKKKLKDFIRKHA